MLCVTVIQDSVLFDVNLSISTCWKLKLRNLKNINSFKTINVLHVDIRNMNRLYFLKQDI